jgi:hypothetical protein
VGINDRFEPNAQERALADRTAVARWDDEGAALVRRPGRWVMLRSCPRAECQSFTGPPRATAHSRRRFRGSFGR